MRLRPLLLSSIVAASFSVLCGACSSGSSANPAGPDTAFCNALKTYATACNDPGISAACTQAVFAIYDSECAQLTSLYSEAFKEGVKSCAPAPNCPSNDPFLSSCFEGIGEVVTATQAKLASDYCTPCATEETASQCTEAFWGLPTDAGVPPGPGAPYLQLSDGVVSAIESACLGSVGDASAAQCTDFLDCEEKVVAGMTPATPAACAPDAGGGDGG